MTVLKTTNDSADEKRQRTADCNAVEAAVFVSLNRLPGAALDDVDKDRYRAAIKPLLSAVWNRRIAPDAPEVWKVVFAVRDSRFRPSTEEVGEMVRSALSIELAAPIEARNVVKAPETPPAAIAAGPRPKREYTLRTYRPDYASLPPDPREWRAEMFEDSYEFACAVFAADRDGRVPSAGPLAKEMASAALLSPPAKASGPAR